MNPGLYVVVALFVLVLVTLAKGVRLVPQGYKWVVQRLGKYHITLGPGLNILIPYIDSVAYKVTTKDIVLDIPSQEVITMDNVVIIANAVAFINIVQPEKSVYGVEDYQLAIRNLVQTGLRSIVGEMQLDDALSSRDMIKAKLKTSISDDISDWGITLKTVEIQDINPSSTMQTAMEEQAAAERQRRATVTRADGEKQAAILRSEGVRQSLILEAEGEKDAQLLRAEGYAAALERIFTVAQGIDQKTMTLQYFETLKGMGAGAATKFIFPMEFTSLLENFVKKQQE